MDGKTNRFPIARSSLVGRKNEIIELRNLLLQPEVGLVTITGPGGVGKTRLALQVAIELEAAFPDGIAFVDLAAVRDATLVPETIARGLDIPEDSRTNSLERIIQSLQARTVLLVIDNFEQVAAAAFVVNSLILACPGLTVLASSRTPLHLPEEREYPLRPLALPDPQHRNKALLRDVPSVALFIERAKSVRPDFRLTEANAQTLANIVERLDGLPLAIELGAARIRHLAPQQILARLGQQMPLLTGGGPGRPGRHQTMADAIRWSYDLLTPAEQRLLWMVAIFVGGFSLEVAETIAGAEVLDPLRALVEHSLVLAEPNDLEGTRYRLLEPIRQFAEARLDEAGERGSAEAARAEYLDALAKHVARPPAGPSQADWYGRLDLEIDNLRAVLSVHLEHGEYEQGLRLASRTGEFWMRHGYWGEGQRWIDLFLSRTGHQGLSEALLASALLWNGILAGYLGNYEVSIAALGDAAEVNRRRSSWGGLATSLYALGGVQLAAGNVASASSVADELLHLGRELGDNTIISRALDTLILTEIERGEVERARHHVAQCNPAGAAVPQVALNTISLAATCIGDSERAARSLAQSIRVSVEHGGQGLMDSFSVAAQLACAQREYALAARFFGLRKRAHHNVSAWSTVSPSYRPFHDRAVKEVRAALGPPQFQEEWEAGQALNEEEAVAITLSWLSLLSSLPPTSSQPPASSRPSQDNLSARETQVLRLVVEGKSNPEIATALGISPNTVIRHVSNIYNKLGVHNRVEATTWANLHGRGSAQL